VEAKLEIVGDGAPPGQYEVHLPAVIGRSRSTDLTLGNPLVSRKHCEVFEEGGQLMVRDLGSLNGTYVGKLRIAEQAMPLKAGDLFSVGPVTFRAVYGAAEQRALDAPWNARGETLDASRLDSRDEGTETPPKPKRRMSGPDDPTIRN
jgi:pSer/pThr/pTyr-binding forkhead associated (FHA) protein